MPELDDATLLAWMTSASFRDFLECESTREIGDAAIAVVADADVADLDAALSEAYAAWERAVAALHNPCNSSSSPARWHLFADVSSAALALGALVRIAGEEDDYEFDRMAVRGSLGLHGMQIVNVPAKLTAFMRDPWPRLAREVAEASQPLAAIRAVSAGAASRVPNPDGSWWAWYALYEPTARAAGHAAAAAWQLGGRLGSSR
jgi:hypothetical protein